MESKFIVTAHPRGSTLRVNISVIRFQDGNTVLTNGPFNVGDLADVVIKCKDMNNRDIEISVSMMKRRNTRKCTMQITCENFSKPICLSDDVWVETAIVTKSYDRYVRKDIENSNVYVYLYTTDVNITALEEASIPTFISKQLYEDVESTDFQLHTADGSVDVHKVVMCTHSDVFRTMFKGEWKETAEGQIKIDVVTVQTLQHLKEYLYLGTLPDEGLEPLLVLAARYMMDKLKEDCSAKLVKTMKPENFDGIVEFAVQNNMYDLVRVLIMETPDNVINKIHQLKKNTDKNDEK